MPEQKDVKQSAQETPRPNNTRIQLNSPNVMQPGLSDEQQSANPDTLPAVTELRKDLLKKGGG